MKNIKLFILAAVIFCVVSIPTVATNFDLTTDNSTTSYNINDAIWERFQPDTPTGSGVFYSFLRVAADPTERGYNTDGRPLQFDEKTAANFTRSIALSDVPLIDGKREFQLDINENKSNPAWYMSLDKFQVWITDDPALLGYNETTGTFASGTADLVYDIDVGADGDSSIKMDFRANPGSGKRDYRVLVPQSMFDAAGADENSYVVLFTRHGDTWETDDGYEEWGVAIYIELGTIVTIDASDALIRKGETVTLTVTETNNGASEESLTDPNVIITPGDIFLDRTSPYYIEGDSSGGGAGDLDYGETWIWQVPVIVNEDITFDANGHGIYTFVTGKGNKKVETRFDVSYDGGYEDERASVTIETIDPDTYVDISASSGKVHVGETVDLTVTEENTGDDPLTNVYVRVYDGSTFIDLGYYPPVNPPIPPDSGDTVNPGVLDVGETWSWTISGVPVVANTTFTASGHGLDSLGSDVTYANGYLDELDAVTVVTINPDTFVTITPSAPLIYAGNVVTLYVSEQNTGNDPLTGVSVTVNDGFADIAVLTSTIPSPASGDTTNIGVLDVGETWSWSIPGVVVGSNTTFTANGTGTDSLGDPVNFDSGNTNERDVVDVYTISPGTEVTIEASPDVVYAGETVTLTVTEKNTSTDAPLYPVAVEVYYYDGYVYDLLETLYASWPHNGDNGNNILDPGETWTWEIYNVPIDYYTTFTAIGHGIDEIGTDITYANGYLDELDTVDVDTIEPGTLVDISASDEIIYAGESVILTITEENTGYDPLHDVYVVIKEDGTDIGAVAHPYEYPAPDLLPYITWDDDSGIVIGNDDDILDPGEVWTWTLNSGAINADVTFTAIGHGLDYFENDITYDNGYDNELDDIYIDTISPYTYVDITASAYLIYAGETVDLYVSEKNEGDDPLDDVLVEVVNENTLAQTNLVKGNYNWYSDGNGDDTLDPDETWYWTITGVPVNSDTTFTATGYGIDSLGGDVTYVNGYLDEQWDVDIDTIDPDTAVTIDSDVYETTPGGNVWLTITEENTGDDPLYPVGVEVYYNEGSGDFLLTTLYAPPSSGDTHNIGVLDTDEIWTWYYQTTVSYDTTFTAIGHGIDSLENDVTYDTGYLNELDTVFVEVEEGFTRTWGFWKTHLYLVDYIFDNDYLDLPIDLGTWGANGHKEVTDVCRYMALMWCNQSNNSDKTKRTKIDAARIHTAHQALAAIMNYYMPNGASLPVSLATIADTLTNGNIKQIRDLGSILAAYNESGEYVALHPSLPPTGKTSGNIADPQGARGVGAPCELYWNTVPDVKGKP